MTKQGGFGVVIYPEGYAIVDYSAPSFANIVAIRSSRMAAWQECERLNRLLGAGQLPLLEHFSKGGDERPPAMAGKRVRS